MTEQSSDGWVPSENAMLALGQAFAEYRLGSGHALRGHAIYLLCDEARRARVRPDALMRSIHAAIQDITEISAVTGDVDVPAFTARIVSACVAVYPRG